MMNKISTVHHEHHQSRSEDPHVTSPTIQRLRSNLDGSLAEMERWVHAHLKQTAHDECTQVSSTGICKHMLTHGLDPHVPTKAYSPPGLEWWDKKALGNPSFMCPKAKQYLWLDYCFWLSYEHKLKSLQTKLPVLISDFIMSRQGPMSMWPFLLFHGSSWLHV